MKAKIDQLNAKALHNEERGHPFYSEELLDTRNTTLWENDETTHDDLTVLTYYGGMGNVHYFLTEADLDSGIAHGFVCLGNEEFAEWGSFLLSEVEDLTIPVNLITPSGTETLNMVLFRDEHWTQRTIADLKDNSDFAEILKHA